MAKTEQGNGLEMRLSPKQPLDNHISSKHGIEAEVNGNGISEDNKPVDKYGFSGGAQQNTTPIEEIPIEVLRHREAKWLEMLNSWDKWMAKKHKKIKERCQKGIPPSLRGRAWLYLTGGKVKREQNKGKFQELDDQPGDPKWVDIIERDLHRQFPFHEMFSARGGHGQQDLFRVLKAYTLHRPEEGYCQAQAPVAALLLMHMPAEDAFWALVQICEKYLPGYYSKGLEAIQLDGEILRALLKKASPVAHRHLEKQNMEPILYMTEWFMCAFSRTLPWASVLRVWDMFLCEGVKILFRVGLVLLKHTLGSQEKLKNCQGLYETMELLKAIPAQYMQEVFLVHEITELSVSERDIEKEHRSQLRLWKDNRGELHCKSPPRMHGARAVMAAEPPSRQDLRQRPTIIVESPLASEPLEENQGDSLTYSVRRRFVRDTEKEEATPPETSPPEPSPPQPSPPQPSPPAPSPPALSPPQPSPPEPSPLLSARSEQGSTHSLSSEQDTYL